MTAVFFLIKANVTIGCTLIRRVRPLASAVNQVSGRFKGSLLCDEWDYRVWREHIFLSTSRNNPRLKIFNTRYFDNHRAPLHKTQFRPFDAVEDFTPLFQIDWRSGFYLRSFNYLPAHNSNRAVATAFRDKNMKWKREMEDQRTKL